MSKLQALAQDLRDKQGGLGMDYLDYLVVSGDLTNTASPKEFDQVYLFLSELINQFGLSAERCIIVPGNHDLSWDKEVYEWKHRRKVDIDRLKPGSFVAQGDGYLIRIEDEYPRRFDNFSKFYHQLTQQPYPPCPDAQGLSFLFDQTRLQFLTLNSSWQIDEYNQENSGVQESAVANALLKADKQVSDARKQKRITEDTHTLRLAVWHHPVTGNEKMTDDAFLERLRDAGVILCLHGHIQEHRTDIIGYTHPRKVRVAGAGSFGAPTKHRPTSTPQLYNVIEIDRDHSKNRVHTREKSREGGSWRRWSVWPDSKNKLRHYPATAVGTEPLDTKDGPAECWGKDSDGARACSCLRLM